MVLLQFHSVHSNNNLSEGKLWKTLQNINLQSPSHSDSEAMELIMVLFIRSHKDVNVAIHCLLPQYFQGQNTFKAHR